ncbi:hypothetical protein Ancab_029639 [Ancistrocladus abbreviatus]
MENKFKEASATDCGIRYLGGKGVLLSARGSRRIEDIVTQSKDQLSQWFTALRSWISTDVGVGRWGWIRLFTEWQPESSDSRSYIEESLPGKSSLEKPVMADEGDKKVQIACQEVVDDLVTDLSLNLYRRDVELGSGSCRGFSRGIFEFGDDCINEDINGKKDNGFFALVALDSESRMDKLGERIGPSQVGHGIDNKGIRKSRLAAPTFSERLGVEGRNEGPGYSTEVPKA